MYINITGFQFSFVGTRYKRSNFDRIFPAKWCSHKIHQFCSNGIQNTNQVKYLYIYILFFVAFCSPFVLFLFAFVLSVLRFTDAEYPFGIFKSSYKIKQLDWLIDYCLRWYLLLQGDNSLKSVERFDHMMFVCRFQASWWYKTREKSCYVDSEFITRSLFVGIC